MTLCGGQFVMTGQNKHEDRTMIKDGWVDRQGTFAFSCDMHDMAVAVYDSSVACVVKTVPLGV